MNESELNIRVALTLLDVGDVDEAKKILREEVATGSTKAQALLAKIEAGEEPSLVVYDLSPEDEAAQLLSRWTAPSNPDSPTYHIDEYHSGGLVLDDDGDRRDKSRRSAVEITYSITDGKTGTELVANQFSTYEEAEEYVSQHFGDRRRWSPPPPTVAELIPVIKLLRGSEEDRAIGDTVDSVGDASRVHLLWQLHQRSLPPDIVARIKRALRL